MADQAEMEAMLDDVLDELDDDGDHLSRQHPEANTGQGSTSNASQAMKQQEAGRRDQSSSENNESTPGDDFQAMMRAFIEADTDGQDKQRFEKLMDKVKSPSNEETAKSSSQEDVTEKVDETIKAILEEMSKADISDTDPNDLLKDMFSNMPDLGTDFSDESFNPDAMIDGMMEQLLSKDLMYEPMKQVAEKFPGWLTKNKGTISSDEHQRRSQQFECFQELVEAYETDSGNLENVLELMQKVQEFGHPPQDIINEIAPGLELDEEGMPKLNPLQQMPFGENEECSIM